MQQSIRIALLIGALILGATGAILVIPTAFPHIPTSLTRVGRILEAIGDPSAPPRLVVLGNSVAMSGIDSRQLAWELGHPGPSYNFSYQGQSLVESYLLQQALGESVEIVVQLVQVEFNRGAQSLWQQKYNNLYMWGYRPTQSAIEKLHQIYGSPVSSFLETGGLSQRFAARWAIQQLADMQVRRLTRPPDIIEHVQTDLTFPVPVGSPISDAALDRRIKLRMARFLGEPYRFDPREQRLLQAMVDEAKGAGSRLAFVFAPVHPRLRAMVLRDDLRALAAYGELLAVNEHVSVIDATSVMPTDNFYDDIHITISGARRLTSMISGSLAAAR